MTADVNFTDLAPRRTARPASSVLHFGPERDLVGDELPPLLAAAAGDESLAEFLGNPVFKVLVLGTRPSDVFTGPLLTPLPLSAAGAGRPEGATGLDPAHPATPVDSLIPEPERNR